MKKTLLLVAISLIAVGAASAQTLLTGFTFETSQPATAGPFTAENGVGTAMGVHTGASVYSSPSGNGSVHSLSSNTWAVGDYYQFSLSTVGATGIFVAFGQTGSNTGPGSFDLTYSVNGGAFTSATTGTGYAVTNDSWSSATTKPISFKEFDLSSVAALDNAASVVFRVVDLSTVAITGGTVATTGTGRVDDFNVSTGGFVTPAPEPASYVYILGGLGGLCLIVRRRVA